MESETESIEEKAKTAITCRDDAKHGAQKGKARRTCKDGNAKIISWNERSLLDQNGKAIGSIAIGRDITKRKELEQQLQESENKYRALVENSPNLIGILQDGVLKYVNSTAILKLGWTFEELTSPSFDPIENAVSEKSRSLLKENIGTRLHGENVGPYEVSLIKKDGSEVPAVVRATKIMYDGKPAIQFSFSDITGRKRVEEALLSERDRLEVITENIGAGLGIISKDYKTVWANRVLKGVFGDDVEGKTCYRMYNQRTEICPGCGVREIFEKGVDHSVHEQVGKDAKGDTVWSQIIAGAIRDKNGRTTAALELVVPITERKRAEGALFASEAKYRQLVENIDELIYAGQFGANTMVNPLTFMSNQVERILGYRAKEFLDDPSIWTRSLHPDDVAEVQAATQMVIEGKRAVRVYRMRKRNSEEYCWLEDHVMPQVDSTGRVTGYLGVARDITERKRMEGNLEASVEERTKELRSTKERLNYLITSNPAVIYSGKPLADLSDWEVTYLSERVVPMLGFEPEKFIGHPEFWKQSVHPEDLGPVMDAVPRLWEEGQHVFEYRILHKNGDYRWIRNEARVARDGDGKPIEVNGYWTDITEKKRVELENEKLNTELTTHLSDVTDRLESLAKSREKLKAAPDVATGLDVVLETVLWDFNLDFGAVLVLDRQANRMNVRASKSRAKEIHLNESYPLQGFVELRDLQAKKSVTRVVGRGDSSIFGTAIIHSIPILAGNEICGVLTFGNEEDHSLRESSVRILELYAELVSSFMIERPVTVTPVLESKIAERMSDLEAGQMYLVKKDPAKAFDVFAGTVFSGYEGLCITRMYPPKVRTKYGLEKTPIVWLTSEASEGEKSVHSIQDLSILIGTYLEKAQKAIILLDGVEYLITNHGFDSFLKFLQILKDRLQRRNAVLIAPVFEQALGPKELALVEREMQALTE